MTRAINEHFECWGSDLGMPLIDHCGYNGWQIAERLSWHYHDGYELVFLLDGQAAFEFEDGGRCELSGGEFFFKLPRVVHRALDDINSPCRMCWVIFDPTEPGACFNTPFTPSDLQYLADRYHEHDRRIFTYPPHLKQVLENLGQAIQSRHSHFRVGNDEAKDYRRNLDTITPAFVDAPCTDVALLRLYVCQLLLETARRSTEVPPHKAGDFVAAAIAYIENHQSEPIGVEQLADELGVSRSYLHTIFRDGTGLTPNDYIQRSKIKTAETLLEQSAASVTQIAADLGFTSSQYFSKVFYKYTRKTPREYRRLHLKAN